MWGSFSAVRYGSCLSIHLIFGWCSVITITYLFPRFPVCVYSPTNCHNHISNSWQNKTIWNTPRGLSQWNHSRLCLNYYNVAGALSKMPWIYSGCRLISICVTYLKRLAWSLNDWALEVGWKHSFLNKSFPWRHRYTDVTWQSRRLKPPAIRSFIWRLYKRLTTKKKKISKL